VRREKLKAGDNLLVNPRTGFGVERLPKSTVDQVVLEEVPDVTYEDIGGLGDQIEVLRDAIELPYLHADRFKRYNLSPPKGILLYGPPGCGKTMIGKAVANSLALRIQEMRGGEAKSYFLNVKARSCSTSTSARPSTRSARSSRTRARRRRKTFRS